MGGFSFLLPPLRLEGTAWQEIDPRLRWLRGVISTVADGPFLNADRFDVEPRRCDNLDEFLVMRVLLVFYLELSKASEQRL